MIGSTKPSTTATNGFGLAFSGLQYYKFHQGNRGVVTKIRATFITLILTDVPLMKSKLSSCAIFMLIIEYVDPGSYNFSCICVTIRGRYFCKKTYHLRRNEFKFRTLRKTWMFWNVFDFFENCSDMFIDEYICNCT